MLWVLARGHRDFTALTYTLKFRGERGEVPNSWPVRQRGAAFWWQPITTLCCAPSTGKLASWSQGCSMFCNYVLVPSMKSGMRHILPNLPVNLFTHGPRIGTRIRKPWTLDILWHFPMNRFPHLLENNPFITHLYEAHSKTPYFTGDSPPDSASSPRNVPRYTAPKPPEPKTWR